MSCLLKLGEHQVQPLHETLFVLLKHHDLVLVLLVGLVELAVVLQVGPVVLDGLNAVSKTRGLII